MDTKLSKQKPPEWLTAPVKAPIRKRDSENETENYRNRNLDYDADENYESYLVDSSGNQYEPYSMSWRYLGVYIDCDIQQESASNLDESDVYRKLTRKLFGPATTTTKATTKTKTAPKRRGLGGDSGDENDDDCSRKVLWAAYHDPRYRGNSIGEYQFYDHVGGEWNTSTCQTSRCAKMDCHASNSHFELIGVFKEADGLVDWAEQLFKHEGYCIWDGDKDGDEDDSGSGDGDDDGNGDESSDYEFMSNRQDYVPQGCYQMYLTDDDGNSVYRGLRPLPGGNITDGLYTDEDCTQESSMEFGDYIIKCYTNYYYDEDEGQQIAEQWSQHTDRWNELMTDYHVCQPCRAYNKIQVSEDDDRRQLRFLDENDGGGDEEQWGYNCYDDAGYRNCNQCYKFETKTDMEAASTEDLERASKQGTILAITVDGVAYGRGGIDWRDAEAEMMAIAWILGAFAVLGIVLLLCRCYKKSVLFFWQRVRSRRFQKSLREAFVDDSDYDDSTFTDEIAQNSPKEANAWSVEREEELTRNRIIVEDQRREIEQIKLELHQENTIRALEWEANHRHHHDSRSSTEHENEITKPRLVPEYESSEPEGGEEEIERQGRQREIECLVSETENTIPESLEPEEVDEEEERQYRQRNTEHFVSEAENTLPESSEPEGDKEEESHGRQRNTESFVSEVEISSASPKSEHSEDKMIV